MHLIIDEIKTQSEQMNMDYEQSLEGFSPHIEKLITQFQSEYDLHKLDEIVVAAIAPVVLPFIFWFHAPSLISSLKVRRLLTSWNPLKDPTYLVDMFTRWRRALKFAEVEPNSEMEIEVHGVMSRPRSSPKYV